MPIQKILKQKSPRLSDIGEAEDSLAGIEAQSTCIFAHIESDKGPKGGFRVVSFHQDIADIESYQPANGQEIVYIDKMAD